MQHRKIIHEKCTSSALNYRTCLIAALLETSLFKRSIIKQSCRIVPRALPARNTKKCIQSNGENHAFLYYILLSSRTSAFKNVKGTSAAENFRQENKSRPKCDIYHTLNTHTYTQTRNNFLQLRLEIGAIYGQNVELRPSRISEVVQVSVQQMTLRKYAATWLVVRDADIHSPAP